jgi:DNA repair exonuclease SbcCD ATPase subunit
MAESLHNLNRKSTRERSNITRFSNSVHSFTEETTRDDYEHYKGHLEEALEHMLKLDDTIHDLTDEEYDADVATREEYIETAKRAIQKAGRLLEKFNSTAPDNPIPS